MPKVLLVGGGGREHAIAKALAADEKTYDLLYAAPYENPGISLLADGFLACPVTSATTIASYAQQQQVAFVIVGSEAALAAGVADALQALGISCIGPMQALAQIETSKAFARELQVKYQIDGVPKFKIFTKADDRAVMQFLQELGDHYVVKADGLCGGKGVKVACEHLLDHSHALEFCREINGAFVIEEKCQGPEFSLISFSDGNTLLHCPAVQDHKRAFDNDVGPNTGGMGSYSLPNHLLPFLSAADYAKACAINEQVVHALQAETGKPYLGIIYGSYMLTSSGLKVIEFNARFGDPEAINILALLGSDFGKLCQHLVAGTLADFNCSFAKMASLVKYVVPNGYPIAPIQAAIDVSDVTEVDQLFYAAVRQEHGQLQMTGSRALAVLGTGETLAEAQAKVQAIVEQIRGPVFYRRDIGSAALRIVSQGAEGKIPPDKRCLSDPL